MNPSVDFSQEEGAPATALTVEEVQDLWAQVLSFLGVERPCAISLTILDDDAMADLNGRWRGVEAPTDVVSIECERPDDPDLAPDEPCVLGDIFLAPDFIARQADAMGTDPTDETRLLAIHGLLHLLGYDHEEEADAAVMEPLEDALVARATDGRIDSVVLTRHRDGS